MCLRASMPSFAFARLQRRPRPRVPPMQARPRPGPAQVAKAPPSTPNQDEALRREADAVNEELLGEFAGSSSMVVGAADDPAEREADAVADRVMRTPAVAQPTAQRPSHAPQPGAAALITRKCSKCGDEEQVQRKAFFAPPTLRRACAKCEGEADDESLRRHTPRAVGAQGGRLSGQVAARVRSLPTRPLPDSVRGFMEPRFGVSFAHIRLATGSPANDLARQLGAKAFSFGQTIAFGDGAFEPGSSRGRHLIAHELAHTLQGTRGVQREVLRRAPVATSSFEDTAQGVWEDVLDDYFVSSNQFEERVRRLSNRERKRLRGAFVTNRALNAGRQLIGSARVGPPQDILDDFARVLDLVMSGRVGQTVGHVGTRPCEPGDVDPVSNDEWMDDPLTFFVSSNGVEAAQEIKAKLDRNSDPETVRLFQRALVQWGCQSAVPARNPLGETEVDGILGPATRFAIRQFQKQTPGLAADGVAGPLTISALAAELGGIRQQADVNELLDAEDAADAARLELEQALRELEAARRPGRNLEDEKVLKLYKDMRRLEGYGSPADYLSLGERADALGFAGLGGLRLEVRKVEQAYRERAVPVAKAALDAIDDKMVELKAEFESDERIDSLSQFVRSRTTQRTNEIRDLVNDAPEIRSKAALAAQAHNKKVEELKQVRDDEIRALQDEEPVLGIEGFPVRSLVDGMDRRRVRLSINRFADRKISAAKNVREQLEEKPDRTFAWDRLRAMVGQSFGWRPDGIQAHIVADFGKQFENEYLAASIALAVGGLVLTLASFGAASPVVTVALGVLAAGAGIAGTAIDIIEFKNQLSVKEIGFDIDDPSFFWVALGVFGSVGDVAAAARIGKFLFRFQGPIKTYSASTDLASSADLIRFDELVRAELPEDIAEALSDGAKLKRATELGLVTADDIASNNAWVRWLKEIDPKTYPRLADPNLAAMLRDLPPSVRQILTKCASDCLPPWLRGQGLESLVKRVQQLEARASPEAITAMNELFHGIPDPAAARAAVEALEAADDLQEAAARLLAGSLDRIPQNLDPVTSRKFWQSKLGHDMDTVLAEAYAKLAKASGEGLAERSRALRVLTALERHAPQIELNDGFRKVIRTLSSKQTADVRGAFGELDAARRILDSGDIAEGSKFQFATKAGQQLPGGRGVLTKIPDADGLRVGADGKLVATEAKATIGGFASKLVKGGQFENMLAWYRESRATRRIEVRMAQDSRLDKLLADKAWGKLEKIMGEAPVELTKEAIFHVGSEAVSFDQLKTLRDAMVAARNSGLGEKALKRTFGTLDSARSASPPSP